jgi:5-methylcytosine-specific restriction endonuclease McrA
MGRCVRVEKPCNWCTTTMVLKPAIAKKQNYCSKSCANRARGGTRIRTVFCKGCSNEVRRKVRSHKDAGLYCSRTCYSAKKSLVAWEATKLRAIADKWKDRLSAKVAAEVMALRRIASRPVIKRLTWLPCASGCGSVVAGYMGYSRTCRPCIRAIRKANKKTEGGKRRRRIEKAMRRAKGLGLRADKIDPIEVFARDDWSCYLCRRKTPKELVGTQAANAPSVDHVVPLSKGGSHTWDNVRCACRLCNTRKGDR